MHVHRYIFEIIICFKSLQVLCWIRSVTFRLHIDTISMSIFNASNYIHDMVTENAVRWKSVEESALVIYRERLGLRKLYRLKRYIKLKTSELTRFPFIIHYQHQSYLCVKHNIRYTAICYYGSRNGGGGQHTWKRDFPRSVTIFIDF